MQQADLVPKRAMEHAVERSKLEEGGVGGCLGCHCDWVSDVSVVLGLGLKSGRGRGGWPHNLEAAFYPTTPGCCSAQTQ